MADSVSTTVPVADRIRRKRPPSSAQDEAAAACLVPTPRLVAATTADTQNTLVLGLWVEVQIVNDRGKPLAGERCILWNADGTKIEKKTNADGVVWFDNLPYFFDEDLSPEDINRPAFQLPDILEEWNSKTASDFAKPDSYRSGDRNVWFVPAFVPKFQVMVNQLSEEDKFQHFRHAYEDNGAVYDHSDPRDFITSQHRWNWGKGAVCNQHVNFFLGFWFNYNSKFTTAGSATTTVCLPLYSSGRHKFLDAKGNTPKHRGYAEFAEPISGEGIPASLAEPPDPTTHEIEKVYLAADYIRISRYFDWKTREPNDKGKALIGSLANFNAYSVSNITSTDKQKKAVDKVRTWLEKHKSKTIQQAHLVSKHKTVVVTKTVLQDDFLLRVSHIPKDKEIKHLTADEIWSIIWILGDDDEELKLLESLAKDYLNTDHHGGILLKRLRGGDPPLPGSKPEDCELWTFSADGGPHTPGPAITMKKFADNDLRTRKFFHIAIWKLKSLPSGGYAPGEPEDNEGNVDTNDPPRFIHWG